MAQVTILRDTFKTESGTQAFEDYKELVNRQSAGPKQLTKSRFSLYEEDGESTVVYELTLED